MDSPSLYVFQTLLFILQSSFFALRSCLNVFVVPCTVPLRHSRRGGGITEKRKGRGGGVKWSLTWGSSLERERETGPGGGDRYGEARDVIVSRDLNFGTMFSDQKMYQRVSPGQDPCASPGQNSSVSPGITRT